MVIFHSYLSHYQRVWKNNGTWARFTGDFDGHRCPKLVVYNGLPEDNSRSQALRWSALNMIRLRSLPLKHGDFLICSIVMLVYQKLANIGSKEVLWGNWWKLHGIAFFIFWGVANAETKLTLKVLAAKAEVETAKKGIQEGNVWVQHSSTNKLSRVCVCVYIYIYI